MQLRFQAVHEDLPGPKWKAHFLRTWPSYSAWFLREGDSRRPGYMTCRRALLEYMPELVPMWERLCELSGGGDQPARMLSLYRPTAYLVACSQAAWSRTEPALIRNYDYHPARCEGLFLHSAWHGTRVIASSDSLWGALDGMNEHGLAASLAFGGRKKVGDGFGVPLVVRYLLEFCTTVDEAIAALKRIPTHMGYSIVLVDRTGRHATVYINPDRPAEVTEQRVSTNHQAEVEWSEHATLTRTVERAQFLADRINDPNETLESFVGRFTADPVVSHEYERAFGTLYTATYRPVGGRVEYRWPNRSWHQSFDNFVEGVSEVSFQRYSVKPNEP